MKKFNSMKSLLTSVAIICIAMFTSSCGGPSQADLRAELQGIKSEMMQLQIQANNMRSQMDQAAWQATFGTIAAGVGAYNGNGQLYFQGAGNALNSGGNYDRANFALKQIVDRWNQLVPRHNEILQQLR